MSKKPTRSRHRAAPVPWAIPKPVELDESYEREVQQSTARLESRYRRALRRFEQAEARLKVARERAQRPTPKRPAPKQHTLAELEALVADRRAELEEYRRMMVSVPASAVHRGREGYRPVPVTHREFVD